MSGKNCGNTSYYLTNTAFRNDDNMPVDVRFVS